MAPTLASDPSPLVQTAVYMAGVLTGYALLTPPGDWAEAWQTVRSLWYRQPSD